MDRLTRCVGYRNGKPIYMTNIDMRKLGAADVLKTALGQYEDTELTPEQIEAIRGHNIALIEQLTEYRQLEEQGFLLRLPSELLGN